MLLRPFGAMNGCCGMSGDRMRRGTAGAPRNAGTEFASGPSGIAVGGTSAVAARARTMTMKTSVQRRSEEHTSELQSLTNLVCRLLLEKKNRTPPRRERKMVLRERED